MTPQRGWSLPPSITNPPLGIKPWAIPRLRCEPPRFDGENAPDWIRKIQKYYNHHYTPLDDRLYLTQYLFDHPASDWREYWVETNKGKGWDDFLLDVKQRFDPDLYESYATTTSIGPFGSTGGTSQDQLQPKRRTEDPVENWELSSQPAHQIEEVKKAPIPSPINVSSNGVVSNDGVTLGFPSNVVIHDADSVSSIELPPQILLTDPEGTGDDPIESVVLTTDDSNALATSHVDPELSPNANYSNVISGALIHEGTCIVNSCTMLEVGKGMLDFEELSEQIDTLLIPPFLPLTLEVEIILLYLMGFKPMEVSYHGDSEWSCPTLRFGGDKGVRIFDPGPFDMSKLIRYGTLDDLTAALSIGVNNEGEDRAGTTGATVEAKIWCHFRSAYFFFPP